MYPTNLRARSGRGVIAVLGIVAAVCLIVVGRDGLVHSGPGDCDNLAGECLGRARQARALDAIAWSGYLGALCALGAAAWTMLRRPWLISLLVVVLALAAGIAELLVDPVSHLQDPRSGWLGGYHEW